METIKQYAVVLSNGESYVTWSKDKESAKYDYKCSDSPQLKIAGIVSLGKIIQVQS